jgi:hypothetical protein
MAVGRVFLAASGVAALLALASPATAQQLVQENGIGADPDGDTNPATNTSAFAGFGSDAELDPPFRVVTFEPPPGGHNEKILDQYRADFGVSFEGGLRRQACQGQRYFQYDTLCTYLAPPSGAFAALYRNDWAKPMSATFDRPVCAAALAVVPTGGREGEQFKVKLQPYGPDGRKLEAAIVKFTWSQDIFRWRNMVGGFFAGPATRVDVTVKSLDDRKAVIPFLIDDLAFAHDGCDALLEDFRNAAGFSVGGPTLTVAPAKAE